MSQEKRLQSIQQIALMNITMEDFKEMVKAGTEK